MPKRSVDMSREIMLADVEAYDHQFLVYRDDPGAETLRAVTGPAEDERFPFTPRR